MSTFDELRELRIEHDAINGKEIGGLSAAEQSRMIELRGLLADTEFMPWGLTQTQRAYESIHGPGKWKQPHGRTS